MHDLKVGDEVEFVGAGSCGLRGGAVGVITRLRELGPSATVRWLDGTYNNVELEALAPRNFRSLEMRRALERIVRMDTSQDAGEANMADVAQDCLRDLFGYKDPRYGGTNEMA